LRGVGSQKRGKGREANARGKESLQNGGTDPLRDSKGKKGGKLRKKPKQPEKRKVTKTPSGSAWGWNGTRRGGKDFKGEDKEMEKTSTRVIEKRQLPHPMGRVPGEDLKKRGKQTI